MSPENYMASVGSARQRRIPEKACGGGSEWKSDASLISPFKSTSVTKARWRRGGGTIKTGSKPLYVSGLDVET